LSRSFKFRLSSRTATGSSQASNLPVLSPSISPVTNPLRNHPAWFVALFGLALLLAGNWALPLIDRDEPRFAEASREMRQSGDWILPRFNGNYRFDKPPFIYWCQAACYGALGENVFAARLPSAMFATVTALLLLFWGRRLGQPRAGFHASIMFLTSLAVLIWGRLSVADMPMIFFFTLAVWSGWEVTRPSARPHWHWFFYASLALGFQAKGPEAWLPLLGLWICRWRRPDNFRLSAKPMLLGIVFTSALVAVWAAPALIQTHGDFFRSHGGPRLRRLALFRAAPLFLRDVFRQLFPVVNLVSSRPAQWPRKRL